MAMAAYGTRLRMLPLRDYSNHTPPSADAGMQQMALPKGGLAQLGPCRTTLADYGTTHNTFHEGSSLKLLPLQGGQRCQHKYMLKRLRSQGTHASAVTVPSADTETLAGIDWDNFGFSIHPTDYMYIMKCERGQWQQGELKPYGNLELSPSAGVLNYGQGLFEGLKAYRTFDGRIFLFRPKENAVRMLEGAARMSMDAPSEEMFLSAVRKTVLANQRWIPPSGKGSLYVRPLLIASGAVLGLAPAPEYSFVVYVSPVGNYFKGGLAPIDLKVETYHHRAAPGGTGGVKTIGNYAPVLKAQLEAKSKGYSDVIYLDAVNNHYVEEVSSCNIFIVKVKLLDLSGEDISSMSFKPPSFQPENLSTETRQKFAISLIQSTDGEISTPELGSILPGVTRKSILELARDQGYKVKERPVSADELMDADEVFCTGTAVVVNPVGSITYKERRTRYNNGGLGKVTKELYKALTEIQMGLSTDKFGWIEEL